MKYDAILQELFAAIQELNSAATLALLNIDDRLLELPDTTRSYIERCEQWKRLLDVVASIPHLIEQGDRDYVPLVGFWGHFSSGKSTLINAILGIPPDEHPPYKRKSGRNPTDKRITLTTHFDHFELTRLEFAASAEKVDIVQGPRSPLLEQLTLVDTPGLGDDPAEMDAVIRFLHLVHVLVLTVDGRRPFADTAKDFHLLDIAFNQLPGVPKIFAITSAVDFLKDRKGDFDTDWDQADAEQFWEETVRRLLSDRRFGERGDSLAATPHHFVDSIEGFQIQELLSSISPSVLDEEQRARTDGARAEYIIRCSVDSLNYLRDHVAERSQHLAALRLEAERRSQHTQTAIENLIVDLERRLSTEVEFIGDDRGDGEELAAPIDQIVTLETVTRGNDVPDTETAIRKALERAVNARRSHVVHRAIQNYRKRAKGADERFRSDTLAATDISAAIEKTQLLDQLKRGGRQASTVTLARHRAGRTLGLETLEKRWERTRVISSARSIEKEFESFERTHDDTVRGLIAYITQPSSIELLQEHGFVAFDELGERVATPESIDIRNGGDYRRLMDDVEQCTTALKAIYDEAAEELEASGSPNASVDSGELGESAPDEPSELALKPIVDQISRAALAAVADLDHAVDTQIMELTKSVAEARLEKTARVREVWQARWLVLARVVAGIGVFAAVGMGVEALMPGAWAKAWSSLPQWMIQGAVSGVVASLTLSVFAFFLIGFSNARLRVAFGSTVLARINFASLQRAQKKRVRKACVDELEKLQLGAGNAVGSIERLLLGAVIEWLRDDCTIYAESADELREIRERVNERAQLVKGLANKLAEFRDSIPTQLRERSSQIRSAAVSAHMLTIRRAAEDVEGLRATIARIAESAREALAS